MASGKSAEPPGRLSAWWARWGPDIRDGHVYGGALLVALAACSVSWSLGLAWLGAVLLLLGLRPGAGPQGGE